MGLLFLILGDGAIGLIGVILSDSCRSLLSGRPVMSGSMKSGITLPGLVAVGLGIGAGFILVGSTKVGVLGIFTGVIFCNLLFPSNSLTYFVLQMYTLHFVFRKSFFATL